MTYKPLAIFFLIWAAAAVVTGAVTLSSDPSEAGGSSESFENFSNTIYNTDEIAIDKSVTDGSNPLTGTLSTANSVRGWVARSRLNMGVRILHRPCVSCSAPLPATLADRATPRLTIH